MTTKPWIAGTLMTAAITTGCMLEPESSREINAEEHPRVTQNDDDYSVIRSVSEARIKGVVGPVTLDHAARPSVYDDGWYLSIESVVELEGRAAMTLLSVSNGQDIWRPGLSQTFSIEDYSADGPSVTMLGCVGQEVGIYDEYDMPADEVDVDIEDGQGEDEMVVTLGARWNDRDEAGVKLDTFRAAQTAFTLSR